VENFRDFFDRFRRLSIGSSGQLDALVEEAQQVIRSMRPQQLREDTELRQHIAAQLGAVQGVLDELLVDRPRRAILRKPR
jgi:hypothetical protein